MDSNIELRKAVISDYDFYFDIKSEKSNIYWTGHDKKPDYNELKNWFKKNISALDRVTYIVINKDNRIGYVYVDYLSEKSFEVSIAISENYQNQGYGYLTLNHLLYILETEFLAESVIAWIFEKNLASKKIFTKCGFASLNNTKEVFLPKNNSDELMREYIIEF